MRYLSVINLKTEMLNALAIIDPDILACIWQNIKYRVDVCREAKTLAN